MKVLNLLKVVSRLPRRMRWKEGNIPSKRKFLSFIENYLFLIQLKTGEYRILRLKN